MCICKYLFLHKWDQTTLQLPLLLYNSIVVQLLSHVQLLVTPWSTEHQPFLSFTISRSLLKLMSIESMMPFNHLILCRPLLLLPSVFASVRVFSNESAVCIRWPEYCSFSVSKKSKQQTALPGPLCELQVSLVIMRGMGHSPGGPTGVGVTKRSASRSVFPPMKWNDHFARLPWVHVC